MARSYVFFLVYVTFMLMREIPFVQTQIFHVWQNHFRMTIAP